MKLIAVALSMWAGLATAGEAECLASIMYSEARGESYEGVIAIGQASLKKAQIDKTTVCKLKGVTRLTPEKTMLEYYVSVANHLIKNPKESVSKGASHWDAGKPHMPGVIRRVIGKHTLYELKENLK